MSQSKLFTEVEITALVTKATLSGHIEGIRQIVKQLEADAAGFFKMKQDQIANDFRDFADFVRIEYLIPKEKEQEAAIAQAAASIRKAAMLEEVEVTA